MGLEDVSKYPNLFAELKHHNWTDSDLIKLAGGNIIRVFEGVESVCFLDKIICFDIILN